MDRIITDKFGVISLSVLLIFSKSALRLEQEKRAAPATFRIASVFPQEIWTKTLEYLDHEALRCRSVCTKGDNTIPSEVTVLDDFKTARIQVDQLKKFSNLTLLNIKNNKNIRNKALARRPNLKVIR